MLINSFGGATVVGFRGKLYFQEKKGVHVCVLEVCPFLHTAPLSVLLD